MNIEEWSYSKSTSKTFIEKYNAEDYLFNNTNYRKGARITCSFGLAEGYRIINGKYYWDSIRLHTGVDRSGKYNSKNQKLKENIVIAPFDFDYAEINDYGSDHVYGSLIRLFNEEFGFEMRIIHMDPNEILVKPGVPIKKDTIIGKAGNYGSASDGDHTHTEFVSLKNTCKTFDDILSHQYGSLASKDYTDIEIFDIYRSASYFKDSNPEDILKHYKELKEKRKIIDVCNRFKFTYRDWFAGSVVTRYSSELLFNGL